MAKHYFYFNNLFSKGADGILLDKLEVAPKEGVVFLRPFDRLFVVCSVPRFDPEIFAYDCVCLMRYEVGPKKAQANTGFWFDEVRESRAYLDKHTMKEFYGDDIFKWNTSHKEKLKKANEELKHLFKNEASTEVDVKRGGMAAPKELLYTPTVFSPGIYTVRLCLDDLHCDPPKDLKGNSYRMKLALSPKSYYRNPSNPLILVVEDSNSLAWAESCSSDPCESEDDDDNDDGDNSGKQYATGKKVKADKFWRPLVNRKYPFNTIRKRVIHYNENDDNYDGKGERSMKNKLAILVHVGKGKAQESADGNDKTKPNRATKVGVFRMKNDCDDISEKTVCGWFKDADGNISEADNGGTFIAMSFPVRKGGKMMSLDFTTLLEAEMKPKRDDDNLSQKLPLTYAVCFIKPGDDKANEQRALCSKDDPRLIVTFGNQQDDKEESDSDDDDQLDYNDVHSKYIAEGKGEEKCSEG